MRFSVFIFTNKTVNNAPDSYKLDYVFRDGEIVAGRVCCRCFARSYVFSYICEVCRSGVRKMTEMPFNGQVFVIFFVHSILRGVFVLIEGVPQFLVIF